MDVDGRKMEKKKRASLCRYHRKGTLALQVDLCSPKHQRKKTNLKQNEMKRQATQLQLRTKEHNLPNSQEEEEEEEEEVVSSSPSLSHHEALHRCRNYLHRLYLGNQDQL